MTEDAFPGIPYRPPDYGAVRTFRARELAGGAGEPSGEAPARRVGAPFWRRVPAFVIDILLAQVLAGFLGTMAAAARALAEHGPRPSLWVEPEQQAALFAGQALPLFLFCYFAFFTAYGGRTPGKMLLGLTVVAADGAPVGPGRALFRTLCYLASVFTWGLGFLVAAGPAKRALHDRLAGTRVVWRGPDRNRSTPS
jgi:uncharacterized RDD family membrane protein YckC